MDDAAHREGGSHQPRAIGTQETTQSSDGVHRCSKRSTAA
jgi:hypothetical protein